MTILQRYLLRRFLIHFAVVFVLLILAVSVVDTLLELDDLMGEAGGVREALWSMALRVPALHLMILIPATAFAAAFVSLGMAARRAEIIAMKAGGISPLRVVLPLLLAAGVVSGLAGILNETLVVSSVQTRRQLDGSDRGQLTFRRGSFWYHRGRFVYNVQDADPEARTLRGVAVFELDPRGRLVRSIHAARAEIAESGDWRLLDASVRRFDPEQPAQPVRFERLPETQLALSEEPTLTLLQADVEDLSLRDLRDFLESGSAEGLSLVRARALLHERLTDPLSAFLFALLAVPLGLRVEQTRSLARPALQGVVLLFLFYLARQSGAEFARQGLASPVATPWLIFAAFAALGLWRLLRVPR